MIKNKVLLMILDGFGEDHPHASNAITLAKIPHFDEIFRHYPHATLEASGEAVGLPAGVMGNSEVGHMSIGSGQTLVQDFVRINSEIENNTLKDNQQIIQLATGDYKSIHLMILLSDGGVHSHINHLIEVAKILRNKTDKKICIHCFLDGRDTPPMSGAKYISLLLQALPNNCFISSIHGRSFAMDRDERFEKIQISYECLTGSIKYDVPMLPLDYIKMQYRNNITDEFIPPALLNIEDKIDNDCAVFFLNFRPDRAREITLALTDKNFKHFHNPIRPKYFLCMSPYLDSQEGQLPIAFDKEKIPLGLSEMVSKANLKQCKIAETEKYAHVTYFFNGGLEVPFIGEERILVPSPRDVATYDLKPEMSAPTITEKLLEKMQDESQLSLIVINFANADMVGHTGNLEAAIKAIESLDECLGKILSQADKYNWKIVLTADHGNADQMLAVDGKTPHTAHTTAKVPFLVYSKQALALIDSLIDGSYGSLKDIAPTIMYLLGLDIPEHFTGKNLIKD